MKKFYLTLGLLLTSLIVSSQVDSIYNDTSYSFYVNLKSLPSDSIDKNDFYDIIINSEYYNTYFQTDSISNIIIDVNKSFPHSKRELLIHAVTITTNDSSLGEILNNFKDVINFV